MKMKDFILKVFSFVAHFDGFEFMYQNNVYAMYILFFALSVSAIKGYLSFIYGIKKSEKKDKYIRKEYNIFQRILLIHWYQNIYKKVDRFWFDIIYRCYLVNLALFVLVMLLCLLCHYFDFLNVIAGILAVFHFFFILVVLIAHLFGTKDSPRGGRIYRGSEKYQRKNW